MKRSRAPSAIAASQTVTTTKVVKKAKPQQQNFRIPRWAGKSKTGFPKELRIKHRYVDIHRSASIAGALAVYSYSCNGMYDPNITGTGHQPLYFDQLAAIYNHYTVTGAKISITACVPNSGVAAVIGVYVNDDATATPTTSSSLCEQSSCTYRVINPSLAAQTVSYSRKWSASENFGPGVVSDPNLQGTAAANPTEQQLFTVFAQGIDGVTNVSVDFLVTIEYDAIWQELKDIAAS